LCTHLGAGESAGGAGKTDSFFERHAGGPLDGQGTDEGVAGASGINDVHLRRCYVHNAWAVGIHSSTAAQGDDNTGGAAAQ
jgi:hypothetical protein